MNILMCEPRHYGVHYEINPWMHRRRRVALESAYGQWQTLRNLIRLCEGKVQLIEQIPGLPDMVFTANAGLVYGNRVWLSRFRFPERQGEHEHFREWFKTRGYDIVAEDPDDFSTEAVDGQSDVRYFGPAFEGAGDGLFLGDTLFAASGFRSDEAYYRRIAAGGVEKILHCELIDPFFYHLDTCFCPLDARRAIWWPEAFSADSRARMEDAAELFAVPEAEAGRFACNAVVLRKHVIMPSGCPQTRTLLEGLGFTVHDCDMSEFIKAGGACKCLTLML